MKISKWLLWVWGTLAVGLVLGLLGLMQNPIIRTVSQVVAVLQLYAVYRLRVENKRLYKAFCCMLASNVAIVGNLLAVLGIVATVATLVFALLGQFQFFWGLDDLIPQKRYAYPRGRIKWCFYCPLLGALVGVVIVMLVEGGQHLISAVLLLPVLWLLWQYIAAVRAKEQA